MSRHTCRNFQPPTRRFFCARRVRVPPLRAGHNPHTLLAPCNRQSTTKKAGDYAMSEIPEGYEPAENSAAKNHAMDALEAELERQGIDPYPDLDDDKDGGIDLINLADAVVEALLKAGVTVPEEISDPHSRH